MSRINSGVAGSTGRRVVVLVCLLMMLSLAAMAQTSKTQPTLLAQNGGSPLLASMGRTQVSATYGRLPLRFEANVGQDDARVNALSRGQGYTLFLTPTESVLALQHGKSTEMDVLRVRLLGSNPNAEFRALELMEGKTNYFIGNDPKKWRTDVPNYRRVRYASVYPGIDIEYYGNEQYRLENDFVVAPGADPSQIRLGITGATSVRVDANGDLVLKTKNGETRFEKPIVYQFVDGAKRMIAGAYELRGKHVGFKVAAYDKTRALVIDPVLAYSTYLSGTNGSQIHAAALNGSNLVMVGETTSTSFTNITTTTCAACGTQGGTDVFIVSLNAAGSAVNYMTFVAGSGTDIAHALAIGAGGVVYVAGETASSNFPVAGSFRNTKGAGTDAFVFELGSAGNTLPLSGFIGGSGTDIANSIAVNATNIFVGGSTTSPAGTNLNDFPLTFNALNKTGGTNPNGWVMKFEITAASHSLQANSMDRTGTTVSVQTNSNHNFVVGQVVTINDNVNGTGGADGDCVVLTVTALDKFTCFQNIGGQTDFTGHDGSETHHQPYSTYLAGSGTDTVNGIAIDGSENVYAVGTTDSTDGNFLATTGNDGFLIKATTPAATTTGALTSLRMFSGTGDDRALAITADATNVYIVGSTTSTALTETSGFGGCNIGGKDAWVANYVLALTAGGVAKRCFGTTGDDAATAVAVSGSNVYFAGTTTSSAMTTTNGLTTPVSGTTFGFAREVDTATLNTVGYTTLIGPTGTGETTNTTPTGIDVDGSGNTYIAGNSDSSTLPVNTNAIQTTKGGTTAGFAMKFVTATAANSVTLAAGTDATLHSNGDPVSPTFTVDVSTAATVNTIVFNMPMPTSGGLALFNITNATATGGGTCTVTNTAAGGVTCTWASITGVGGVDATITITATIQNATVTFGAPARIAGAEANQSTATFTTNMKPVIDLSTTSVVPTAGSLTGGAVAEGDAVTFTITAHNPDATNDATNTTISATLPAGFTADTTISSTLTGSVCTATPAGPGGSVSCSGTLPANTDKTMTIVGTFANGTGAGTGTVAGNSVTATTTSTDVNDTNAANNAATSTAITSERRVDLEITAFTVDGGTVPVTVRTGATVTYAATVRNTTLVAGAPTPFTSTARSVTITFNVGSNFTFSAGAGCTQPGGAGGTTVVCTTATLADNATYAPSFTGTYNVTAGSGSEVKATSAVAGSANAGENVEKNAGNETSATINATVERRSNVSVTVTGTPALPATVNEGVSVSYLVDVANAATIVSDASASDPTGNMTLTFTAGTFAGVASFTATLPGNCSGSNPGPYTCTVTSLVAAGSASFTISGTYVNDTLEKQRIHTNGIHSDITVGPFINDGGSNNSATHTVTVDREADVAIGAITTAGVTARDEDQALTFTVPYSNNGPNTAVGLEVTFDPFNAAMPAGATFFKTASSVTCTGADPGPYTCTVGNVANAGSGSFTVTGHYRNANASVGPITYTGSAAEVNPAAAYFDSTTGNDSNTSGTIDVTRVADIHVTVTGPATYNLDTGTATYTFTVANQSANSRALAVALPVTIDAVLTGAVITPANAGNCPEAAGTVTCASIAPGASETFTVVGTPVIVGATQAVTPMVSASSSGDYSDPDGTDNSASQNTTVQRNADIGFTNFVDSKDPYRLDVDGILTYTLSVKNNGPSTSHAAIVTGTVPAHLSGASVLSAAGATCSIVAGALTCDYGAAAVSLASGATDTITVTGTPTLLAGVSTETYSFPMNIADANVVQLPNTLTDTSTQTTVVNRDADLFVATVASTFTKVRSDVNNSTTFVVDQDTLATYTVRVGNKAGFSIATGVDVSIPIPAGFTNVATATAGCAPAGPNPSPVTINCTGLTINAGATFDVVITAVPTLGATPSTTYNVTPTITSADVIEANAADNTLASPIALLVQRNADIGVTISDTLTTYDVDNGTTTYTFVVSNSGPSNATSVKLGGTLTLGAGLTYTGTSIDDGNCTFVANALSCTFATLNNGSSITFHVTGTPTLATNKASALATFAVSETAPTTYTDGAAGNNSANDSTTVRRSIDLSVTVTPSAALRNLTGPNNIETYTLLVTNNGTSDATFVKLTNTLPPNFTVTGVVGCAANGLTCTIGSLPKLGGNATVSVTGTVDLPTNQAQNAAYTFTSVAGTDDGAGNPTGVESNAADNTATGVITVQRLSDLAITSVTPFGTTINDGQSITYTINGTNNGSDTATNVRITIALAGTPTATDSVFTPTAVSPGCTLTNPVICTIGTVANGGTPSVSVQGTWSNAGAVPSATGRATATISTSPASVVDGTPANDSGFADNTISRNADLGITVSSPATLDVDQSPAVPLQYTFVVSNSGPSNATNLNVAGTLNNALTGASVDNGNCTFTAGTTLACSFAALANGASVTFHVTGTATLGAGTPTLAYTFGPVTVSSATTADGNAGNDTSTSSTTVNRRSDVGVTITDGLTTYALGAGTSTYTIVVSNAGASKATNVTLTGTVPAGLSGAAPDNGACSIVLGTLSCTFASVNSGASVTFHVTGTPTLGAGTPQSTFTFPVSVSPAPSGDYTDGNAVNDSATDNTSVERQSNLGVAFFTVPTSPFAVDPGTTYVVRVSNAGPSDATNVRLQGTLPVDLQSANTATPGCGIVGTALTCTFASLANGAFTDVTVTGTPFLAANSPSNAAFTFTAAVDTNPASVIDAVPGNDSATNTITIERRSNLGVTLTDSADPLALGQTLTYTFTASNAGPSAATNVVMTGALDATLSSPNTVTAGCGIVGTTLTCTIGNLASAGTFVATVTGTPTLTAAQNTNTMSSTANVSSTSVVDNTPGNNNATQTTVINRNVDLSITMTPSPSPFVVTQNSTLTYTVNVANAGGLSDATNVDVVVNLPNGSTVITPSLGNCTVVGVTVDCTKATNGSSAFATLASGGTNSFTITLVPPALNTTTPTATLNASATISSTTSNDTVPGNNATGTVSVTQRRDSDLQLAAITATPNISGTGNPFVENSDGTLTYAYDVTNLGPSDATHIKLVIDVPSSVTVQSTTQPCTSVVVGAVRTLTCTDAFLTLGATTTSTFNVIVAPAALGAGTASVNLPTAATVSSTAVGNDTGGNNTLSLIASQQRRSDLNISIIQTVPGNAPVNTDVDLTVSVGNGGPSNATNLVLTVPIPIGLSFVSVNNGACAQAAGVITCNFASLAINGSITFHTVLHVEPTAGGSVIVQANVSSASVVDPVAANNSAQVTLVTLQQSDLVVTLGALPAKVNLGSNLTYTFTVANKPAHSTATGTVLLHDIAANVTFVSAVPSAGTCSFASPTITCNLGSIATGTSVTVVVTVTANQIPTLAIASASAPANLRGEADQTPTDDASLPNSVPVHNTFNNNQTVDTADPSNVPDPSVRVKFGTVLASGNTTYASTPAPTITGFTVIRPILLNTSATVPVGTKVVCFNYTAQAGSILRPARLRMYQGTTDISAVDQGAGFVIVGPTVQAADTTNKIICGLAAVNTGAAIIVSIAEPTNHTPVADGSNTVGTGLSGKGFTGTTITLDSGKSFDQDNANLVCPGNPLCDNLTYLWSGPFTRDYQGNSCPSPVCIVDPARPGNFLLISTGDIGKPINQVRGVSLTQLSVGLPLGQSSVQLTVFDQLGNNSTATVAIGVSGFTVNVSPISSTVRSGQAATFQVSLGELGAKLGTNVGSFGVILSCRNSDTAHTLQSLGITCSPVPNLINVPAGQASTVLSAAAASLLVSTTPLTQGALLPNGMPPAIFATLFGIGGLPVFGMLLLPRSQRKRARAWMLFGLLLMLVVTMAACGGGGNTIHAVTPNVVGTPPGIYTIEVVATVDGNPATPAIDPVLDTNGRAIQGQYTITQTLTLSVQ